MNRWLACWLLLLSTQLTAQPLDSIGLADTSAAALDSLIAKNQAELSSTRARLDQVRQQLVELGQQEQMTLAKIDAYAERIALTRRYLAGLSAQAEARRREVAAVAREIERITDRISQRKRDLGRRLVAIYKYGRTIALDALLSTRSLTSFYRRMVYLRWIARADQRLADEMTVLQLDLGRQRARLEAAQAEISRLQEEQARQQASLAEAQEQERILLRSVRSQSAEREAVRAQLQAAADRLTALVLELEAKRANWTGAGGLAALRGKLPWPVRGTVVTGFGTQTDPRYGTRTTSLGIDIKTKPGEPVKAVAAGRVAYADRFMGYGNLIIIDHGDGYYTLYGGLDEMAARVGAEVGEDTPIGTVGESLHFEVRKDGRPVDPMIWLGK